MDVPIGPDAGTLVDTPRPETWDAMIDELDGLRRRDDRQVQWIHELMAENHDLTRRVRELTRRVARYEDEREQADDAR